MTLFFILSKLNQKKVNLDKNYISYFLILQLLKLKIFLKKQKKNYATGLTFKEKQLET